MSENLPVKYEPDKTVVALAQRTQEVEALMEVVNDFETALNLIKQYQRALNMLSSPDPNTVPARKLLNKYQMVSLTTHPAFRILLDGRDITDFPDSIPGDAEVVELEAGDDSD